ncbi:hypothetical protein KFK09_028968 [Dendrobium nobile]|uniref:Retrovirus-related Pol polyprotein from transposon TNT 1-94-like beta-barrel domain-containing protein n=1 Tax=Dendrobium nobile TaxID=94219 RepID=A0A8T3A455_DENNO|nr:hypothetical protein KFK09_028968 [Dendrobium nobile]
MANTAASQIEEHEKSTTQDVLVLSSTLKFVVSNLKSIVQTQLTSENYSIWRSQISKVFCANGFDLFLNPTKPKPTRFITQNDGSSLYNPDFSHWNLTDQNLSAAICSTITAPILPYIIHLDSTAAIWSTLETRFQSTNRSKVIQLKNELHNIALKNSTITQYLADIKTLVDNIASAGSQVDTEDIILYILNGLPPSYQSFKTAIRTMLNPISLENLYALLLSEEVNIAADASKHSAVSDPQLALASTRGRGRRNKGRTAANNYTAPRTNQNSSLICQICLKKGHGASSCWHRLNPQYVPQSSAANNTALAAGNSRVSSDWFLDSGASAHLTNSLENLSVSNPYHGQDAITIGDGSSVNIANSGSGLVPTPNRKLNLSKILHTPNLHYNLLSISQLTKDNNISISFDSNGFSLKDPTTQEVLLRGPCRNGLYPIQATTNSASPHDCISFSSLRAGGSLN